jgi:hypothetical protein
VGHNASSDSRGVSGNEIRRNVSATHDFARSELLEFKLQLAADKPKLELQ